MEDTRADPDHQLPAAGDGTGHDPSLARESYGRTAIGQLVRDLADDTRTLVRQEVQLAKMEVAHGVKRVAKDSAWIGAGAAVVAVGGLCLVLALALGLGALLGSYWLGTLITGGVLLIVGGLFAWKGVRDLKKGGLMPRGSVDSLKTDRDWAKREAEELKRGLTEERA